MLETDRVSLAPRQASWLASIRTRRCPRLLAVNVSGRPVPGSRDPDIRTVKRIAEGRRPSA
jgi:hypothetical protein